MKTFVGTDEEPGGQPLPVDLAAKPIRDPQHPDGFLLWVGSLALLGRPELTADNLPELVELAQQYLADTFPDDVPPLRMLIVPDKSPGLIDRHEVAVVTISEFTGWGDADGSSDD